MSIIVLIPAFIAAYFAFTRSPHWAFIYVYVPVLLWFPPYYAWHPPIIPDPNFYEATVAPIMLAFLMRTLPGWRFSFTDILVLVFAFATSYSEFTNYGYKDAQNLAANMILSVVFPYMLAKSLIEPAGLRTELAKSIVFMLFIISFFLVFETFFRSGYTLWQKALGPFFQEGWQRGINTRWGLTRANGPFIHPIQAGIIMALGFRLQQWLEWTRAWPTQLKKLPKLPFITIPQFITISIGVGLIAPLSRAPWLASVMGVGIVFGLAALTGFTRKTAMRYWIMIGVFVALMSAWFVVDEAATQFASVERDVASEESKERQTIAYRFELFTTYGPVITERWMWGWGRLGWPVDKHQTSVDNAFILLALNHGLITVGCFIAVFVGVIAKLMLHIIHSPATSPPRNAFSITLLSLFAIEFFSLTTVSLNTTNMTLLFILFGWADSYLHNPREYSAGTATASANISPQRRFQFRRVL